MCSDTKEQPGCPQGRTAVSRCEPSRAHGPSKQRSVRMTEGADLHGEEHVRRYRETNGQVGHIWRRGAKILLLTTKGRKTGEPRTTPLIYEHAGDGYVIVASNLGAREHPGWYRNLVKEPRVELQVKGDVFSARARTAVSDERQRLWKLRGNGRTTTSTRSGRIERSRWSCSSASERAFLGARVGCRAHTWRRRTLHLPLTCSTVLPG